MGNLHKTQWATVLVRYPRSTFDCALTLKQTQTWMERKPSFPQRMVLAQSHILLQRKREETAWEIGIQCPFSKSRPGFSFQILDLEKKKEKGKWGKESPLLLSDWFPHNLSKNIPWLVTLIWCCIYFSYGERLGRSYKF